MTSIKCRCWTKNVWCKNGIYFTDKQNSSSLMCIASAANLKTSKKKPLQVWYDIKENKCKRFIWSPLQKKMYCRENRWWPSPLVVSALLLLPILSDNTDYRFVVRGFKLDITNLDRISLGKPALTWAMTDFIKRPVRLYTAFSVQTPVLIRTFVTSSCLGK